MRGLRLILGGFVILIGSLALGVEKDIPEIGKHYPVFIFEKNENPQNILVTYVKLNRDCRFESDPESGRPVFDFYWLMDRKRYKPVHPMIKSGIRQRLEFVSQSEDSKSFTLRLSELNQIDPSLKSTDVVIRTLKKGSKCLVEGVVGLGSPQEKMRLESIYSESKKTIFPPFRKVESVTLTGFTLAGGEKITRTYSSN